jgi:Trypsin-co-occurring domain 1
MAQSKEVAQFLLEDGTPFLVEIDKIPNRSLNRVSRGGSEPDVVQASKKFEEALDMAIPVAKAALNRIRTGLTTPADEVELKFGLKLTAETGAIIASVGGEVNFEITLKWKHEKAG